VLILICVAISAAAQDGTSATAQPNEHSAVDTVKFLAGGGVSFIEHEAAHLVLDVVFDAHPYLKSIDFGGIPFFAVAHRPIPPRQEFAVSSAGFWTQEATSEWLLTRHPDVRRLHAPFEKGSFAFDVLTSAGYGVVAMLEAGPPERDTHGMAVSSGVDERVIGALVLAPALLDIYRYFNPESRWAVWSSRAVKMGAAALVLKRMSSPRQ
jgi:hypothetical protein